MNYKCAISLYVFILQGKQVLKIYKSLIYNTIISIASFILFLNNYWQLLLYDFYISATVTT